MRFTNQNGLQRRSKELLIENNKNMRGLRPESRHC
jgi:hypothetical protein